MCLSDPEKIIPKLHVNWARTSAQRLKRALEDLGGGHMRLVNIADGVLEHCDACRAFEKVLRGPIAATSAASTLNEKLRADLLFLDDTIALRAADVYSKYFSVMPARPRNPQ